MKQIDELYDIAIAKSGKYRIINKETNLLEDAIFNTQYAAVLAARKLWKEKTTDKVASIIPWEDLKDDLHDVITSES